MRYIVRVAVTLLSLLFCGVFCGAQRNAVRPVEPTATPQEIGGSAAPAVPTQAETPPPELPTTIAADQTVSSLEVQGKRLVLEGTVQNDLVAVDSDLDIEPSAHVGGHVVAVNSHVVNRAGESVRVTESSNPAPAQGGAWMIALPANQMDEAVSARTPGSWSSQQLALLMLGLLGALLLSLAAPDATTRVSNALAVEPARCIVVGLLGGGALLVGAVVNAALMHSPVRLLWAPLGAVVAIGVLVVLGFGWLSGMRHAGDALARRLGQSSHGPVFARIALGLGAFFVLKLLLGAMGLGVIGLLLELGVAITGLGAILITGAGTREDWLSMRLRGNRGWATRR